jgi:hypothetical protein
MYWNRTETRRSRGRVSLITFDRRVETAMEELIPARSLSDVRIHKRRRIHLHPPSLEISRSQMIGSSASLYPYGRSCVFLREI